MLLARREKSLGRISGRVDATETDLDEILFGCSGVGQREELYERIAAVDVGVLHKVAVVEEGVCVAHCAITRVNNS